jgi:hypothetical protein
MPMSEPKRSGPLDRRVPMALLYTVLAAVLLGHYGQVQQVLAELPAGWRSGHIQLRVRVLWAALHVAFYVVVPLLLARSCGVGARELGLRLGTTRRQLGLVLAVAVCGLLVILPLARTAGFLLAYPLYRPWPGDAAGSALWLAAFGAYLFSIELFFRGFLPALLTSALGRYALLIALGPYVATHSYLPEALGAIPVGLLLGVWRERCGSLWPGYLAHFLVALEIELIAQWRHGLL